MAAFIKVGFDGVIESSIILPDSTENTAEFIANDLQLDGAWVPQVDPETQYPGASYIDGPAVVVPEKPFDVDWLVYSEDLSQWVPNVPFPEDADFVLGYGPQPDEVVVEEITTEDGVTFTRTELDIPEGAVVYVWNHEKLEWMLKPEIPANAAIPTLEDFIAKVAALSAEETPATEE